MHIQAASNRLRSCKLNLILFIDGLKIVICAMRVKITKLQDMYDCNVFSHIYQILDFFRDLIVNCLLLKIYVKTS